MDFSHDTYISPLTWRYGSTEMRHVWSEINKRRLLRRVWLALAEAQHAAGLVTREQLADLRAHVTEVDIARASEIEAETKHDLVAELQTYAQQCVVGGGILHLGATSTDILDNAEALRLRDSLDLILNTLRETLTALAEQIARWADTPALGFTHLQPAEPTTIGYRLALYGQDLLDDHTELTRVRSDIKGKGMKGAVGTSASFTALLSDSSWTAAELEARVMDLLDLDAFPITSQTYPRKQDWRVLNGLAGLGATLYKFAFDLRLLQSPVIGEWSEPFGDHQVGSSAMPFKRNPINAEKIDSLARYLAGMPRTAWDNAAHSLLERTLDDSANRRLLLPEAFLITDELLNTAHGLIKGLRVDEMATTRNLAIYGVFAGTEPLLMALAKAGADRQVMHARIRDHTMKAWAAIGNAETNPLDKTLPADDELLVYLSSAEIRAHLNYDEYIGEAPARAKYIARELREAALS